MRLQIMNILLRRGVSKRCYVYCKASVRQFSSLLSSSDIILSNTKLRRPELVPEISLHLMSQELEIWNRPHDDGIKTFPSDPFWAVFWPGGQAVCRYLLDNRQLFFGKKFYILGCGSGAEAIAALLVGAKKPVSCNDIDELALQATQLNVKSNGFLSSDVNLIPDNLLDENLKRNAENLSLEFDVLLVGDLFYDEEVASKVFEFINTFIRTSKNDKKVVFLGDPGRWCFESLNLNLRCLGSYNLPKSVQDDNSGFSRSYVFTVFC